MEWINDLAGEGQISPNHPTVQHTPLIITVCVCVCFTVAHMLISTQPITSRTVLHLIQPTERQTCSAMNSHWSESYTETSLSSLLIIYTSLLLCICFSLQQFPLFLWQYLTDLQFSQWRACPPPSAQTAGFSRPIYHCERKHMDRKHTTQSQASYERKQNITVTWGGNSLCPKYTSAIRAFQVV